MFSRKLCFIFLVLGVAPLVVPTGAAAGERQVISATAKFAQTWSIARDGEFMRADLETDANVQLCDAAENESQQEYKDIIWAQAKSQAASSAETLLDIRVRSTAKLRKQAKAIKAAISGLTHQRKGEVVRGYVHALKAIKSLREAAEDDRQANLDVGQQSCITALGQHQNAGHEAKLADRGYELALLFFFPSPSAGGKP